MGRGAADEVAALALDEVVGDTLALDFEVDDSKVQVSIFKYGVAELQELSPGPASLA